MQIPILSGIVADEVGDFRTRYPRNMEPVPKDQGISAGFLRPSPGLITFSNGLGPDRGGIRWNDACLRVSGQKLVSLNSAGTATALGDIPGIDVVAMTYSFDRLGICANGGLYYWNGVALTQVSDTDLGNVFDVVWIDGYFVLTDGMSVIVTELTDPTSINPLKYGSSEVDPDAIMRVLKVRDELTVVNRYTIEVFDNIGGDLFPFQRIPGAVVTRGAIGRRAACVFEDAVVFLGGGVNESPGVYVASNGGSAPISTHEIDIVLGNYSEAELSAAVVEVQADRAHRRVLVHLPDQTLVYDAAASKVLEQPVWFTRDSGNLEPTQYRARGFVWCFDRWIAGDPTSSTIFALTDARSDHFGQIIGWEFGTVMLYNEGRRALVRQFELVALPGRVPLGADPTIWHSYSLDGETWSQERPISAGKQGERAKRIVWRPRNMLENYRTERFRGTSDAFLSLARLEADLEPMNG